MRADAGQDLVETLWFAALFLAWMAIVWCWGSL